MVDPAYQPDNEHALTTWGGILTIISTMVGGGIVGLPYAFLNLGIFVSVGLVIVVAFITINSCWIYLRSKD